MKHVLKATLICLLLAVACVGYAKPETKSAEPRLIGEWETEPTLGQLGITVVYYHFKDDGTFVLSVTFKSTDLPVLKTEGTYKVKGDQLITTCPELKAEGTYKAKGDQPISTKPDKEGTLTFSFEGDTLVLGEGPGKISLLKRK